MQGKVVVRRDAGQVVAGNAVTNIENYVAARPSRWVLAVAFFSASASRWRVWLEHSSRLMNPATSRAGDIPPAPWP